MQPSSEDDPLPDKVLVEFMELESFLAYRRVSRHYVMSFTPRQLLLDKDQDSPFLSWLWCKGSLP